MAVNVKMGVDTSAFKSSIQEATAQIKTFDAQLKYAEATMKATGSAEQGLTTKMNALNGKLETQKKMAQQMAQQLEKMRQAGVDPLSKEYQKLATSLLNVSTGIVETESELNNLTVSEIKAANGADKLTQSVSGISKKISLDQVIGGIEAINNGLENAAKKAVDFGKQLWDTIMDTARRSDDVATMASMYDIPLQKYKQMLALQASGLDTTVDAMLTAQDKLNKGIGNSAEATMNALRDLNLLVSTGKYETMEYLVSDNPAELFWEAGEALLALSDAYDKEAAAQALFGRSWKELKPLFMEYKSLEEYEAALENVAVSSEEATENSAELADRVGELENTWTQLKDEIIGAVAPTLSEGVQALNGVLSAVLDYLQKPEGQEALSKLGDAISGLFADLSKIDPEGIVKGFTEVFTAVTGGIQWLVDNAGVAKGILGTIVTAWGAIEIGEKVLKVFKFIDGIRGLGSGAAEAGAAAGASWGGAFASAVAAAAPWLIGLYTMLNPADTANSDLFNSKTGKLTDIGIEEFIKQAEAGTNDAYNQVAELFEGAAWMLKDINAMNAMAQWMYSGYDSTQRMIMMQLLEGLGYSRKEEYELPEVVTSGQTATGDQTGEVVLKDRKTGKLIASTAMDLTQMESYEVDVTTLIDASDGKEQIESQVGIVTIPAQLAVSSGKVGRAIANMLLGGSAEGHGFGYVGGGDDGGHGYANGLPWVMNDGLYLLHRGERVLTASENKTYTYNNNNYFGSVNLNNGQDIDALCDSIDRHNRRNQRGFGE